MPQKGPARGASGEAGFTLVEALVAIVVLVFGLLAVTNLMVVAASSNSVANQSTAAVTSATRVMDMIKATSFTDLTPGGSLMDVTDIDATTLPCNDPTLAFNSPGWHCNDDIPGVGTIHTHWMITQPSADQRLLYVRVQSEGLGVLAGARSRADFTTFRSCTNSDPATGGCPPAP
jgi:Tfp pilus assembly protein PilV